MCVCVCVCVCLCVRACVRACVRVQYHYITPSRTLMRHIPRSVVGVSQVVLMLQSFISRHSYATATATAIATDAAIAMVGSEPILR